MMHIYIIVVHDESSNVSLGIRKSLDMLKKESKKSNAVVKSVC